MFSIYESKSVEDFFRNFFFFSGIVLALLSIFYSEFTLEGFEIIFSGCLFLLITALLSKSKVFSRSPFSLIFSFFTFLYFSLPIFFIIITIDQYQFGYGLTDIPFERQQLLYHFPEAVFFLLLLWLSIWCALVISASTPAIQRTLIVKYTNGSSILTMILAVLLLTAYSNFIIFQARASGEGVSENILTFIFTDHAFLLLVAVLLNLKINAIDISRTFSLEKRLMALAFVLYIFQYFYFGGSKAAILVSFNLLVFYSLSFVKNYPGSRILFPSVGFSLVLIILAPALFYIAYLKRIHIGGDFEASFLFSSIDSQVIQETFKQIMYRFSQGGIDRYLLVYQSYMVEGYVSQTAMEFSGYMIKNFINLVMPGTIYPEAYAPSSQIFSSMLDKTVISTEMSSPELLKSLNTQPYTLFGLLIILFGWLSPFIIFILGFVYTYLFAVSDNLLLRIAVIYLFGASLSAFGIETVLANTIHLVVSMVIMYYLLSLFSSLRMQKTRMEIKS